MTVSRVAFCVRTIRFRILRGVRAPSDALTDMRAGVRRERDESRSPEVQHALCSVQNVYRPVRGRRSRRARARNRLQVPPRASVSNRTLRDVKLGHLRDSYYEATYGTLEPEP